MKAVEDRQQLIGDEFRRSTHGRQWIESNGRVLSISRVQENDVVQSVPRHSRQDVLNELALRFYDYNAPPGIHVLDDEIKEGGGFSSSGGADYVKAS
jgi:hypothetical protein